MNCRVLYFTRSGNSKRIAEKIAGQAGCEISQITDDKNWKGFFGFMRGGYYASRYKMTNPLVTPKADFSEYDRVLIVGPVWAGNAAPAVYSLLEREKANLQKVCLVLSSGGGDTDAVFRRLETKTWVIPFKFGIPGNKADEDAVAAEAAGVLR